MRESVQAPAEPVSSSTEPSDRSPEQASRASPQPDFERGADTLDALDTALPGIAPELALGAELGVVPLRDGLGVLLARASMVLGGAAVIGASTMTDGNPALFAAVTGAFALSAGVVGVVRAVRNGRRIRDFERGFIVEGLGGAMPVLYTEVTSAELRMRQARFGLIPGALRCELVVRCRASALQVGSVVRAVDDESTDPFVLWARGVAEHVPNVVSLSLEA